MGGDIRIDPGEIESLISQLAVHGACGPTGVARLAYTPDWLAAQELVGRWYGESGLRVERDAVGNLWGRLQGHIAGPSIATGSHLDSVVPGGRFDGALGVVGGLLALRALRQAYGQPKRTLEAVAFCEEESSRFPSANFWGSRAVAAAIHPKESQSIMGYDGVSIGEAMRSVGLDPGLIPNAARKDIDVFLELHVEQGPLLEEAGLEVGIVNAITGLRSYVVELVGRSDHAGAMPQDLRRDPMAGAAEIISRSINSALESGRPAVTTVGRMLVDPNLPTIVPERVVFTVDARHPDPIRLKELYASHEALFAEVSSRRRLECKWPVTIDHAPCLSDSALVSLLEETSSKLGLSTMTMHSGAGHDSQEMAKIARVAMIFVRSQGGRSHTPFELTSYVHAARGIELLASSLRELAY